MLSVDPFIDQHSAEPRQTDSGELDLGCPPDPGAQLRSGLEPIPGYRLLEPLGSGGFGQVWKCEAPGGLCKAIKFVFAYSGSLSGQERLAEQEFGALQRVKAIRHPFVLSIERVEVHHGDLIIVMELADKNLHDVQAECQAKGLPGIPRRTLLRYLREAAEALDVMNEQHQLQHLDIKPENLFLMSDHVKVGDFGLVESLREVKAGSASCTRVTGMTPRYTSPELLQGSLSARCDQYSLAIVYQELLTGRPPFNGKNSRVLALQHMRDNPNLEGLLEAEQALIAKALSKDPNERFASCLELIDALVEVAPTGPRTPTNAISSVPEGAVPGPDKSEWSAAPQETRQVGAADSASSTRRTIEALPRPQLSGAPANAPATYGSLTGYHFLECLDRQPGGEVWLVQAPDGRQRRGRILQGCGHLSAAAEKEAIQRLVSIWDPALPRLESPSDNDGRALFLSDVPEKSLRERLVECQNARLPGIPREELLDYLVTAGEALDRLFDKHGLQHLALNPSNLLLSRGRVLLDEFGLAEMFWIPGGEPLADFNPRYNAPELLQQQISRYSDQYSLALIYAELVTGSHPCRQRALPSRRNERSSGRQGAPQPDLGLLPVPEREVLTRALRTDPRQRFPTCSGFLQALEQAPTRSAEAARFQAVPAERLPSLIDWPKDQQVITLAGTGQPPLGALLPSVIASAAGAMQVEEYHHIHYLVQPGEQLQHRCAAWLPPGVAQLKLGSFAREWHAQITHCEPSRILFYLPMRGSFWQRCLGREVGLEVQVQLAPPRLREGKMTQVSVLLRPRGCRKDQAQELLWEVGPRLLDSLRSYLQASPEQREQPRLLCHQPVQIAPVEPGQKVSSTIKCHSKDISTSGIGLFLPHKPTSKQVYINLGLNAATASVGVLANIVRVEPREDGWYEIGAEFPVGV
jgi:serine/threonine protein kinase